MGNGQSIRPCTYCGHGEFINLPNVAVELKKVTSVFGVEATQAVTPFPKVSLLVCTSCGRVEWFSLDLNALFQSFPGANVLRSG